MDIVEEVIVLGFLWLWFFVEDGFVIDLGGGHEQFGHFVFGGEEVLMGSEVGQEIFHLFFVHFILAVVVDELAEFVEAVLQLEAIISENNVADFPDVECVLIDY